MKIRQKADPQAILTRHAHDRQLKYIQQALRFKNCYMVDISQDDYDLILLKSSIENRYLPRSELPSLTTVINQIAGAPHFLDHFRTDGGLSGRAIKEYLDQIHKGNFELNDCFIIDKLDGMTEGCKYYIKDGMHRLVAVGIAMMKKEIPFPVSVYYCTDTDFEV